MKNLILAAALLPSLSHAYFGVDDRIQVLDVTRAPYSSIGKVSGALYSGTGSLVGPGLVLTAAHVARGAHTFELAFDGKRAVGGTYTVKEIVYPDAYLKNDCDAPDWQSKLACMYYDFAFLVLEGGTPPGTPVLELRDFPGGAKSMTKGLNVAGYGDHALKGMKVLERDCQGFAMFDATGKVPLAVSECTASKGDSGAPLLLSGEVTGVLVSAHGVYTPYWSTFGEEWTDHWYKQVLKRATLAIGAQAIRASAQAAGLTLGR